MGVARPAQMDLFDGRRKRSNKPAIASEDQHQISLMAWAETQSRKHPELALLYHVPNGGYRARATAARLKKMGVKKGVFDLDLPVPRQGFHGLKVELKTKGGRMSDEQKVWLQRYQENGYRAEVCEGWERARDVILDYLTQK